MLRSVPAAIAVAVMLTIAVDIAVIASYDDSTGMPKDTQYSNEVVQAPGQGAQISVAPLKKRYVPHLLIASEVQLPAASLEKVRKVKGVKVVEVVDGANTQVAGRQVGLLGVDPSTFRNLAPKEAAKLDDLWRNVAGGDVVISFTGPKLGTVVSAGSIKQRGSTRVGAVAAIGIPGVQAIVSRDQAKRLGLASGNAILVSAPKTNLKKLKKQLQAVMPKGVKYSELKQQASAAPQVANNARSPLTGTVGCSPHMQAVRNHLDALFGPFYVIGCARPGDPQDHGTGNAADFMISTGGAMPSADRFNQGDRMASYVISNHQALGLKYIIWRQHIWNPSVCKCWRPMGDRGSITQNHFDHPHISVN